MKASSYESLASCLAFAGVLVFGFAIFPLVNPVQWELNWGREYAVPAYVCAVLGPLTMYLAWCLSRWAQSRQMKEKAASVNQRLAKQPSERENR
jgi:hypothetical protein